MTGIRKSFAYCRERDGFGTGIATTDKVVCYPLPAMTGTGEYTGAQAHAGKCSTHDHWLAPPPGSSFSHTSSRSVQRVQTTGSKFWDAQAYGQMSGTWEWSFPLSYDYIEPLLFAFEDVRYYNAVGTYGLTGNTNIYSFRKANSRRVRSFTVRVVQDDRMIGSSGCEEAILKGCVVTSIDFTKSNSESPMRVSMKGFYSTEELKYSSSLPRTVYRNMATRDGLGLVEWAGLYRTEGVDDLRSSKFMANTESLSIGMGNSSAAVYSVCSPFAANYYEGQTSVQFSAKVYYTDPLEYRSMLFGQPSGDGLRAPMSKGLKPYEEFAIIATNLHDDPPPGNYSDDAFDQSQPTVYNPRVWKVPALPRTTDTQYTSHAYLQQDYVINATAYVMFHLNDAALRSYVAEKGDGSHLTDSLSTVDCRSLDVDVLQGGTRASQSTNVRLKSYAPIFAWSKYSASTTVTEYEDRTVTEVTYTEGQSYAPYGVSTSGFIMAPDELFVRANEVYQSGVDAWFSHVVVETVLKHTGYTRTDYSDGTSTRVDKPPIYENAKGIMLNPHALDEVDSGYGEPTLAAWQDMASFRSGVAAYNSAHPDDPPLDPYNLASGEVIDP